MTKKKYNLKLSQLILLRIFILRESFEYYFSCLILLNISIKINFSSKTVFLIKIVSVGNYNKSQKIDMYCYTRQQFSWLLELSAIYQFSNTIRQRVYNSCVDKNYRIFYDISIDKTIIEFANIRIYFTYSYKSQLHEITIYLCHNLGQQSYAQLNNIQRKMFWLNQQKIQPEWYFGETK